MPRLTYAQIAKNIDSLANRSSYSSGFIYELLLAYGAPKTTITKLKQKGASNVVRYRNRFYYEEVNSYVILESEISSINARTAGDKTRPRLIIVTNLVDIAALDTKTGETLRIPLSHIDGEIDFFYPLTGNDLVSTNDEESALDRRAADLMKRLYDEVRRNNLDKLVLDQGGAKRQHGLNAFFTRLLFCYFAEDTGIFKQSQFTNAINNYTAQDGSDTADFLSRLFVRLDKSTDEDRQFSDFPYVDGTLFDTSKHELFIPDFNAEAHRLLIEAGKFDWSKINPDIFGTIFQSFVDIKHRADNGMDYTSRSNIEKVIKPLFLDELHAEFDKCKRNRDVNGLRELWGRISQIKIFDPACGSGNFLVISYKELRQLEIDIIDTIDNILPSGLSGAFDSAIRLDNFYGIEIDDFAHELAILSLHIAAHQMNMVFNSKFAKKISTTPLQNIDTIVCANAIRVDWNTVCPNKFNELTRRYDEIYVIGNPPYKGSKGKHGQDKSQKADMKYACHNIDNYGCLDYVGAWFIKASAYINGTSTKACFVSTNSICQGEQAIALWPAILANSLIDFAYQSFKWKNSARDIAGVTVCIICIIWQHHNDSTGPRRIYTRDGRTIISNVINEYLLPTKRVNLQRISSPISEMPAISYGSYALDGGYLEVEPEDYSSLERAGHDIKKYVKRYVGAKELINGNIKYCLWIDDSKINEALADSFIRNRVEQVKNWRGQKPSERGATEAPWHFIRNAYRKLPCIAIPIVSSENRVYIPMGVFSDGNEVVTNAAFTIYLSNTKTISQTLALLESRMHMAWIRTVCGKMRTDYRYSATLGYNTFPVPKLNASQKIELTSSGRNILAARYSHPEMNLAQLYDKEKMPTDLREAHEENDRLVDGLYSKVALTNDDERLEILFDMYSQMIKERQ